MKTTKKIGDEGEDRAAELLKAQGYRILERNYRTRYGEIDIIAEEGSCLVFVEVKAKSSDRFGEAAAMLTGKKIRKVVQMAEWYIMEGSYDGPWRIDAVTIDGPNANLLKSITA